MFVILAYDIHSTRVHRVSRAVEKYLFRVQESVFEGYITDKRISQLKNELQNIIVPSEDSVVLYTYTSKEGLQKMQLGLYRNSDGMFL
jgi:CRISPR-associated protein Cas2